MSTPTITNARDVEAGHPEAAMTDTKEIERRVAEIIQEEVGIEYTLNPDGSADPNSLRLHGIGAAILIVYECQEWFATSPLAD